MPDTATTELRECCQVRDELWRSASGYDFLGDIDRRLRSYTANLNALARHQRGERSQSPNLPDEVPVYLGLLGLEWRGMVPSTWNGEPISVYQQMANLMSATATACAVAVANGRWAVNEHVRAERYEALLERIAADFGPDAGYRSGWRLDGMDLHRAARAALDA
jgi:hypothetical protein